jgi:transcription elongation GreA/GreB family factor
MNRKLIVTKQSFDIRGKLHREYGKIIKKIQVDKEEARSQGDLSENFGYAEAKKAEENYKRIQGALGMEEPVDIVDPQEWVHSDIDEHPRAMVGALVTILRAGNKEELLIGGAWDSDLNNPKVISYTSPLAKSLIPKPPGFKTTLETSGEEIEILSAKAPSKEDIDVLYSYTRTQEAKPPNRQTSKKETSLEI